MVPFFARGLPDFFRPRFGVEKMRLRGEPQGKNRRKWGTHNGEQGKLLPLLGLPFLVSRLPFSVLSSLRSPFSAFSAPQGGKVKWGARI